MKLYCVKYGHTSFIETSREYIWVETEEEAKRFAEKHQHNTVYKLDYVYAAATAEDKPTPPGLDTYLVIKGDKL